MTHGIIGRKLGMTQVFAEDGTAVPVTVIEAGPCHVVQVRDGGVQLGYGAKRDARATKAELGHAKKAGLDAAPRCCASSSWPGEAARGGREVKVDIFAAGELVKVTGTTKGRGFQGVVQRYGFGGGPASHGDTRHRKPGLHRRGHQPVARHQGQADAGSHGRPAAHRAGLGSSGSTPSATCCSSAARFRARGTASSPSAKQGGPSRHD